MTETDVIPGYLTDFARNVNNEGITSLQRVGDYTNMGQFSPSELKESAEFAPTLEESTKTIKDFLTAVDQGLNWLEAGARKIAETYDYNEHRVTTRMSDTQSRPDDLPPTSPELQGPSRPSENSIPSWPAAPDWVPPGKW